MSIDINQAYKGKRVFITGHTGFKGAWLLAWLHELGAVVKGYALPPNNDKGAFATLPKELQFESVLADIRNREMLSNEVLSFNPDYIFHLAAQPLVRYSYLHPSETFDVNVTGTSNVLEAAKALPGKCVIVVITTDKVYYNNEWLYSYRENDQLGGFDPYSASKACTELVVNAFRNSFFNISRYATHQKAIASARAGNVIGGGDWSADRIIPDIVNALHIDEPVNVRNPSSVRPWQHVLEPLKGYLLLGALLYSDPTTYSKAYNFGPADNQHIPVKALVELAIKVWGSGRWRDISDYNEPHEAGLLMLDINLSKRELNWHPILSHAEAISLTIDWYKHFITDNKSIIMEQIAYFATLSNAPFKA